LDQNWRGSGPGERPKKIWDPLRIFATVETIYFNFGTQIEFRTSLPKNNVIGPKLAGVWARGASKKIWDPLRIFATVEASNFKVGTQIGFGTSLPENDVLDQNWRGSGPGEHPKKFGTLTYFCNR